MTEQAEATEHRETRSLYCALTQPEFNARATEYAKADQDLEALELEKKQVNDEIKDKIGGAVTEQRRLRRIVLERREKREVSCTWYADWASKSMLLRRDDTGEVVEARTMTADEVQKGFDFGPSDKRLSSSNEDTDALDG